jgi:NAD(P)-dependent dehydrogenase (short-subunit alcohol dehydrogenase family)
VSDAAGKTVLITGSTDGLGRATALELAAGGATVLVHGRDPARVESTAAEVVRAGGERAARSYVADLASLEEVRRLAEQVKDREDRLDVLMSNAGVTRRSREESADGYELTFAVNYLSHFLLTGLLLPLLERSAPARIVNVASIGQSPIDFEDVMLERGYDPMRAYSQSKLAQIMFTFELAERLRRRGVDGVTVNALHPATLMDTKMVRESYGRAMTSVQEGVDATVRLAVAPELDGVTGQYFDGQRESRANAQAYDPGARERLWELSERLTGVRFP